VQRVLESRAFLAAILAMGTGVLLFYRYTFPDDQIFLRVISVRAPEAFLSFKYLYYTFLFTTPYLAYSTLLSGLYIFTLKARRPIHARETIFFSLSVKYTILANRYRPKRPTGSRFLNADCLRESRSLAL
jgi:hypothetical protein